MRRRDEDHPLRHVTATCEEVQRVISSYRVKTSGMGSEVIPDPDKGANLTILNTSPPVSLRIKFHLHMAVTRDQVELCKFITTCQKNVRVKLTP